MTLKKLSIVTLTIVGFFISTPALAATEIIARSGQVTPIGQGSTFGQFGATTEKPIISASGRVCYFARVLGLSTGASAVFCSRQYGNQAVWTNSFPNQAPGTPPGVRFDGISNMKMSSFGDYVFKGSLAGTGVDPENRTGAWINNGVQGTQLLIRDNGTIPGIPGATLTSFDDSVDPSISAYGVSATPAIVRGIVTGGATGGNLNSVLIGNSNSFTQTVYGNQILFGQSDPNIVVAGIDVLNATRGPAAYGLTVGLYAGGSVPPPVYVSGLEVQTNKALVSTLSNGDLHLIGRTGITQVPDMADGVKYTALFGGALRNDGNSGGDLAFLASFFGPNVAVQNNKAIFLSQNGVTRKIVRLNDLITSVPGARYLDFSSYGASFVKLADNGAVVFTGVISGLPAWNGGAIFYTLNNTNYLVARNGVEQLGLPAGTYFENVSGMTFGSGAKVGSMGDVALAAKLLGTGVTTANDVVVTLWNPDAPTSGLHLVAREGDLIENRYQVTTLSNTGADLKINSRGQIVFTATVYDTQTQTSKTALIAGQYGQPTKIMAITGGTISGITTPLSALYIRPTTNLDAGTDSFNDNGEVVFVAVMTADSDEAVVLMDVDDFLGGSNSCPADFDQNGTADVADIFSFLSAWFAQNISADANGNGTVGVDDIFAFLSAWFAGC